MLEIFQMIHRGGYQTFRWDTSTRIGPAETNNEVQESKVVLAEDEE